MTELMNLSFEKRNIRTVENCGATYWVAKDVCETLGYKNHSDAISKHCKGVAKRYPLPSGGGVQNVRVIGEPDLMRLIVNSKLPQAERFERWVFEEVLPSIRKTGSYHPALAMDAIRDKLAIAQQKLRLFEEYNEDILYDFDQVSAAMQHYVKPPFGPKHLKKWLADRNILCKVHHKNDKPVQYYIDKGWFKLVMHEWKRRGQRRYEPRYLITQRGFNEIVDLALREKILFLPVPKQGYLPYFAPGTLGSELEYRGDEPAATDRRTGSR